MLTFIRLTVLFEDPFWVGVFEVEECEFYKVSKVTFGAEPKDVEVLNFILRDYYKLNFLEQKEKEKECLKTHINPKRLQKKIKKQLQCNEIGTKAQIALKKQHETNKMEQRKLNREKAEIEEKIKFEKKRIKRKEKHRGH